MTSMILNIPLLLISSLGILFNGYIVTAVLITRQVNTANNILLLHLGVVDLLLGILFLVFSDFTKTGWLNDGPACVVHGFFFTLLHPLALWTICGLNCDRYYAIAAPLHYSHIVNPKKVLIGLSTGWIISFLLCLPPLFTVAPYGYITGLEVCAPNFDDGVGILWYSTLYTAFTLLLPATIIICCNLKILMIARYHRHRIASAIYEVTLSAQVTITHQRNPFFVPTVTAPGSGGPPKVRGRSAIYTVFQLVGSMILLYLPYYSLIIWGATVGYFEEIPTKQIHPNFFTTAMILLTCSSPINGFLYGVKSKALRKTFKNYWRKKQTKSEVIQEIQARTPSTCGSRRPSLTPLGFLTKPTFQRRLSEALLDVHKAVSSPQKHKIKRITTELTWRPISANSLNLLPKDIETNHKIKQTTSCNMLQVPTSDDISIIEDENNRSTPQQKKLLYPATGILQKLFGNDIAKKHEVVQNILDGSPRKSPRITITRTFSEESDSSRIESSIMTKKLSTSSSAVLFDKKWRNTDNNIETITTKPLLDNSSNGSNSSDSSESSESSGGKIFMNLDYKKTNIIKDVDDIDISESETENQMLLWKNHRPNTTLQSQDIILH